MRMKFLRTRVLPIGIDLGTSMMKVVQLRRTENDMDLISAASAEVPAACRDEPGKRQSFLTDSLRDMLKSHPFKGHECVLALPASATYIQHVKTAKVAPAEMEKTLRWEMEGKLPFEASTAVIRHVIAGETYSEREAGLEVIVVAASRAAVEDCLELARQCRLTVAALEVECSAILGCFARLFRRAEDKRAVNLFLDLGHANTRVVIAHGNKLVFSRNLPLGARHIEEMASATTKVPIDQVRQWRLQTRGGVPKAGVSALGALASGDLLRQKAGGDPQHDSSGSPAPAPSSEDISKHEGPPVPLHRDGAPEALRPEPLPEEQARTVDAAIDEALEGLSGEITKCLRYYESVFPTMPVERGIFLGGPAADRRLCGRIAQRLNLPAQIGDPLARVTRRNGAGKELGRDTAAMNPGGDPRNSQEAQPAWAVAVGLSLGGMPDAPYAGTPSRRDGKRLQSRCIGIGDLDPREVTR